MTNLPLLTMIADGGLTLALLFLCYRLTRQPGRGVDMGRIRSLESGVRGLVREAERASRDLGRDLEERQKTLEQLLFDLESVESRVNRAVDSGERLKRSLENMRVPSASEGVQPVVEGPTPERSTAQAGYAARASFEVAEPASFEAQQSSPQPPRQQQAVATNIYGEPIGQPAAAVAPPERQGEGQEQFQSLKSRIEKEVAPPQPPAQAQKEVTQGLEDIYSAAEELLRSGQSLENVAARTRLPVDEVQMLSQIIKREKQSREHQQSQPLDSDERLGVLGSGMRRTRQVL